MKRPFLDDLNKFQDIHDDQQENVSHQAHKTQSSPFYQPNAQEFNENFSVIRDELPKLNIKKINCPTTLDTPVKQKKFNLNILKRDFSSKRIISPLGFFVSPKSRITSTSSILSSSSSCIVDERKISENSSLIFKDTEPECHQIFEMPEIVSNIIEQLHLESPQLKETVKVNRLFNNLTSNIIDKEIKILNGHQLIKFNRHYEFKSYESWKSPEKLTVYCTEYSIDKININFKNLKYLEIRGCKKMVKLPKSIIEQLILKTQNSFSKLETLKLPGCINFSNDGLIEIIGVLRNLKELDLRQCYKLSDKSIIRVIKSCKNIESLNLNRKPLLLNNSHDTYYEKYAFSDRILHAIVDSNLSLHTLGIGGSNISDQALWELCTGRNDYHSNISSNTLDHPSLYKLRHTLKRLSCNDCIQLTELSIPNILKVDGFPNLQVLEIKNLKFLDSSMLDIFKFKINKELKNIPVLISCCEYLQSILDRHQATYNIHVIEKVIEDLTLWCNKVEP